MLKFDQQGGISFGPFKSLQKLISWGFPITTLSQNPGLWRHFVCCLKINKRVLSNSEGESASLVYMSRLSLIICHGWYSCLGITLCWRACFYEHVLCPIKVNSNTIELTVHGPCYCILDLLCAVFTILICLLCCCLLVRTCLY